MSCVSCQVKKVRNHGLPLSLRSDHHTANNSQQAMGFSSMILTAYGPVLTACSVNHGVLQKSPKSSKHVHAREEHASNMSLEKSAPIFRSMSREILHLDMVLMIFQILYMRSIELGQRMDEWNPAIPFGGHGSTFLFLNIMVGFFGWLKSLHILAIESEVLNWCLCGNYTSISRHGVCRRPIPKKHELRVWIQHKHIWKLSFLLPLMLHFASLSSITAWFWSRVRYINMLSFPKV